VVVAEPLAIAVQASILNPGAKLKRNDCKAGMSAKASLICLPRWNHCASLLALVSRRDDERSRGNVGSLTLLLWVSKDPQ
jgi:hypothetical protein